MKSDDGVWRYWVAHPPRMDMLVDLTREPTVPHATRWTMRPREMHPRVNVAGLFWRPSVLGVPTPLPPDFSPPPEPTPVSVPSDALGEPLRSGAMYVSSRHGLVPVSVEGVRFMIDKEASR